MHASVRALLKEVLDYAGLFPPVTLPLSDALRNYLRAKKSAHGWMLGRFVCPVAQLPELLDLARGHPESAQHLKIAALGKQGGEAKEFVPQIEKDLKAIRNFNTSFGRKTAVDVFEVAAPSAKPIVAALFMIPLAATELGRAGLPVFFEIPRTETWREDVEAACTLVHDMREMNSKVAVGLKLRAGGLAADAFPSDAQVAMFIERCRTASVPWKATAGLHHPRRHHDEALQVWHHGFLNVFLAGILALAQGLGEADLEQILADRDGQHFRFANDTIAWKDWSSTTAQIAACRTAATSFGSCSFEEPVAELQAMGLID